MKESSQIQSFVRRQHRMTPGQGRALDLWWPEYELRVESGWLECSGKCILEIGFGMGHSLLANAERYPDTNFIGVEVHRPGIGALLSVAARRGIRNIKVYEADAVNVLKKCIKDNALSEIQIYFPDPWPKNRHRKRRLIQADFTELLSQKLKSGGLLHMATDWPDYAEQMLAVAGSNLGFRNCAEEGSYLQNGNTRRAVTKFEQRSLNLGRPIWDLLFEKITPTSAKHQF